jgi:hypothetical protein
VNDNRWEARHTDATEAGDAEWRSAREEAIAVLRDALGWNMTAARWAQVGDAVEEIASAAAASPDALWEASSGLELYAPQRVINRVGGGLADPPTALPAPKAVRGRIVELVDALAPPGQRRAAGDAPDAIAGAERTRRE